jgi:hypothetical protein
MPAITLLLCPRKGSVRGFPLPGLFSCAGARGGRLRRMIRMLVLATLGLILCGCAAPQREAGRRAGPITPVEGITVWPDEHRVEIAAVACLEAGWLEQIACSPRTREHESLAVIEALPSSVHAALLLAGFEPGAPGAWSQEDGELVFTRPTGDPIDIFVRYEYDGRTVDESIRTWITSGDRRAAFPEIPWVFAGSFFAPNPEWMGPGEHYVADQTGSIIGLVTFGDEVVAFEEVFADQQDVQPLQWQVRTEHVPAPGTPVTLILRPAAGP